MASQTLPAGHDGAELSPLAIDLFCGLGGWTEGLLALGYRVVGYDIEEHVYGDQRYPGEFVLRDVLTIHGSEFKDAALIVASPPCQFFSYTAMPWSRAKKLAADVRADPARLEKELALFNACFRIQREACEASGRHIPMVVENVRGAIPWVGRSRGSFGSFHLWGDVPALMPKPVKATKNASVGGGSWFAIGAPGQTNVGGNPDGRKVPGFRFDGSGRSFQTASVGIKNGNDWFGSGKDCSAQRKAASGSKARKAASAMIAKIPEPLSRHIGLTYWPADVEREVA